MIDWVVIFEEECGLDLSGGPDRFFRISLIRLQNGFGHKRFQGDRSNQAATKRVITDRRRQKDFFIHGDVAPLE